MSLLESVFKYLIKENNKILSEIEKKEGGEQGSENRKEKRCCRIASRKRGESIGDGFV